MADHLLVPDVLEDEDEEVVWPGQSQTKGVKSKKGGKTKKSNFTSKFRAAVDLHIAQFGGSMVERTLDHVRPAL